MDPRAEPIVTIDGTVATVDVEHFPLDESKSRIQGLVDMAHATAPAAGFEEVLVPGEPEQPRQEARARDGIPLPDATVSDLTELGIRYSTPFTEAPA